MQTDKATAQHVQDARTFALRAHGAQMYGQHPYSFHLDAVASILQDFGDTAVMLGYLHDVLEDTHITEEELTQAFGTLICTCTQLVSDCEGANRKERKRKTHAKLASVDVNTDEKWALIVKAADRLANVRECVGRQNHKLLEMYKREHEAFREAVWRQGLAPHIWQELDTLIQTS